MIDKESMKQKVIKAIALMPYDVDIYRVRKDSRGEFNGHVKVTELTGILYKDDKTASSDSKLEDTGKVEYKEHKNFLIDYNAESVKVSKGDFIVYGSECWKILSTGENFGIYFDMRVMEHERIAL